MTTGSKTSRSSALKSVATFGYISTTPVKTVGYISTAPVKTSGRYISTAPAKTVRHISTASVKTSGRYISTAPAKTVRHISTAPAKTVGYISTAPVKTTVTLKGGRGGGGGESSNMNKSRVSFSDKQTGCYGRVTTKEKASAGEVQRKNGTTGTKSEYKKSSSVRIGDKSGYIEVYNEQRVRKVSYNNNGGTKKLISHN